MTLQYRFFSIPITREQEAEDELNAFLRSVRVAQVQRELVNQADRSHWAVVVEYIMGAQEEGAARRSDPGRGKRVDYKEVLSPADFAVYSRLREWRKATAAAEAVQLYTIFMNEQLAAMVENRVTSREALLAIEGIGKARADKYGEAVLAILRDAFAADDGAAQPQQEGGGDAAAG